MQHSYLGGHRLSGVNVQLLTLEFSVVFVHQAKGRVGENQYIRREPNN